MNKKFYIVSFEGGYIIRTNIKDYNYLRNALNKNYDYDYDTQIAEMLRIELDQYKQYIHTNCKNFHKSMFGTVFRSKDEADSILEWIESVYETMDTLAGIDHIEFKLDNSGIGTSNKLWNSMDYTIMLQGPIDKTVNIDDVKITVLKQRDIKNKQFLTTDLTNFIIGE